MLLEQASERVFHANYRLILDLHILRGRLDHVRLLNAICGRRTVAAVEHDSIGACSCLAGILDNVQQSYLELGVRFTLLHEELIGLISQSFIHA